MGFEGFSLLSAAPARCPRRPTHHHCRPCGSGRALGRATRNSGPHVQMLKSPPIARFYEFSLSAEDGFAGRAHEFNYTQNGRRRPGHTARLPSCSQQIKSRPSRFRPSKIGRRLFPSSGVISRPSCVVGYVAPATSRQAAIRSTRVPLSGHQRCVTSRAQGFRDRHAPFVETPPAGRKPAILHHGRFAPFRSAREAAEDVAAPIK